MLLSDVIDLLAPHPHITGALSLRQLVLFIQLTSHLRARLLWHVSGHVTDAPLRLPPDVSTFLELALGIDGACCPTLIGDCWFLLRGVVWDGASVASDLQMSSDSDVVDLFATFGSPLGIGA